MSQDRKRKPEDQSPTSPERPKKSRRLSSPPMSHFVAPGFAQDVYTPLPPDLPSPFTDPRTWYADPNFDRHLEHYGPAVRLTFDAARRDPRTATIRDDIRGACDPENIVWADPVEPLIIKSAEGLLLTENSGTSRTIRFRRVSTERGFTWFAFVERGLHLRINGYNFAMPHDIVVGPFPDFSILEYGDRVVFIFLKPSSVDYKTMTLPGNIGNQNDRGSNSWHAQQLIDAVKRHRRPEAQSLVQRVENPMNEGSFHTRAAESMGEKPKIRRNAAVQPEDEENCQYYKRRVAEWKLLQSRHNIYISQPANENLTEWLIDGVVYRAISSVTTAIELENDVRFAQLDLFGGPQIQYGVIDPANSLVGHGGHLFIPWNTSKQGLHWILAYARMTNNGPEITYYDSSNMAIPSAFQAALRRSLWAGGSLNDQPSNVRVTNGGSAKQVSHYECGYYAILNAWCVALGMVPSTGRTGTVHNNFKDVVEMINLAISGLTDSATIQAFLRCKGFVDRDATVASDRHFTRSIRFQSEAAFGSYIQMRRFIETRSTLPTVRLDVENIRFLLQEVGLVPPLPNTTTAELLYDFSQWLFANDLVAPEQAGNPPSPISPISPATIKMALRNYAKEKTSVLRVPSQLPQNLQDLRQVWNIYHSHLKRTGYLQTIRRVRQRQKDDAQSRGHTQVKHHEGLESSYYPYENHVYNALDRMGMLPGREVLTTQEVEQIKRAAVPRIKVAFRRPG